MNTPKRLRVLGALIAAVVAVLLVASPGSAVARDRNHDRIPDRWERHHHLSLKKNQARRDQDRDQLKNRQEFKAKTNPRDADTDNDGTPDGEENAGTIASFDGTTLVINLFNGTSVSGLVTDQTEIECEGPGDDNDQGDDDQGDDDSGTGGGGDNATAGAAMSSDDDAGDDDTGDDDQGDDDDNQGDECTTADLVPDTVVKEADLELANGQATFEEVELVK
jgi:hypothetical protein